MQRLARAISAGLLLVIVIAGPAVSADRTVTMRDNRYAPATVTIRPGDTVTWANDGQLPHDASGNGWATSLLDPGQSDAVTFSQAGTYRYACTIHAEMRGTVVVRAAGTALPPTDTLAAAADMPASPAPAWMLALVIFASGVLVAWMTHRRLRASG